MTDIQNTILENIIEMRGEISSIVQAQKSMNKYGDRLDSLESSRTWVYGFIAAVTVCFSTVLVIVQDKIDSILTLISSGGHNG